MRGFLKKYKGNIKFKLSNFKTYSKKKKMTIMSIAIVVVLFAISGISALADNIQTDIGSSSEATKCIQLNTCKAVDTSKTLAYVTNKENIPFVITIKEQKGLIFNKSSAYVWTPVILTQSQKDAFVRAVKNCVSKTANTTVLSKDRVKNYYASLNNLNNEKDRWFTPTGSSSVTKVGETTVELSTTNNTLRVVDNSLNKNFKYVIYGSFKKTNAEYYLSHGLTDATASNNVNPEDDNDTCPPQPTDGGGNTSSKKNHVAILDVGIHIPGAEFDKASKDNTATFIFAKKDKAVSVWTSCEVTTEQKLSITKQIQKSVKTVSDTSINSVASNGDITTFYGKNSSVITTDQFADYKVTNNNGKLSLSATEAAKMEWYCGGIIEFRDKACDTTTTLKDYRIEELKKLQEQGSEKNCVQNNTAATEATNGPTIVDNRQSTPTPTITSTQTPTAAPTAATTQQPNTTQTPVIDAPVTILPQTQAPQQPVATQAPQQPVVTQAPQQPVVTQTPQQPVVTQAPEQGATVAPIEQGNCNNGGDKQQVTEGENQSGQKEENTTAVGNDSTPKTGDNANVIVYIILGILAVFGIAYFFILRKKITE